MTLAETLIIPVVLYSHETWDVEDQRTFNVFERKVLHTIYGKVQIEDESWRWGMNHELNPLVGSDGNETKRYAGRARWIDQVESDLGTLRRSRGWKRK